MPHATIIMEVQVDGRRACASSASSKAAGSSGSRCRCPALLTIQSGINQLRYATLKGIMAAKKKEIRKVAPAAGRAGRAADHPRLRSGEGQEDPDAARLAGRRREGSWSSGCATKRG